MREETKDQFAEYYREASLTPEAIARFQSIMGVVQGVLMQQDRGDKELDIVDIGCGAGTQSMMWAEEGHRVQGIDINTELVAIARRRATDKGYSVVYHEASAENLPWEDNSADVCLVPELLEHVANWKQCLKEFDRILRPRGVLYLSTNNVLCPIQQEFSLPLYSWYPSFLKRRYEKLAVTTRPELVNHASFPAINWFSFYSLHKALLNLGLVARDRFDTVRIDSKSISARLVIGMIRMFPPARFIAHVFTPYTAVVAVKNSSKYG